MGEFDGAERIILAFGNIRGEGGFSTTTGFEAPLPNAFNNSWAFASASSSSSQSSELRQKAVTASAKSSSSSVSSQRPVTYSRRSSSRPASTRSTTAAIRLQCLCKACVAVPAAAREWLRLQRSPSIDAVRLRTLSYLNVCVRQCARQKAFTSLPLLQALPKAREQFSAAAHERVENSCEAC